MPSINYNEDLTMIGRALRSAQPRARIACAFTDDPGLLHQYLILRNELFARVAGGARAALPDAFDKGSQFLIARCGRQCLAGGRLTISAPGERRPLPMEKGGKPLAERFLERDLHGGAYGEFSRFTRLPELPQAVVITSLASSLIRRCIAERVEQLFLTLARADMLAFKDASEHFGIRFDVVWAALPADNPLDEPASAALGAMNLAHLLPIPSRTSARAAVLV